MSFIQRLFPFYKNANKGKLLNQIQAVTGVSPKDKSLYELAFRHCSANGLSNEESCSFPNQNNERLEFLGDAILGAVVATYLYEKYPDQNEGYLTRMRSKIVSRKNLNQIANELGLTKFIVSNLSSHRQAKSIGGDTLEALIGAIYLDQDIQKAKDFIHDKILHRNNAVEELENTVISYKSSIIEWAQKERISFNFNLINQHGKQHNMTFEMELVLNQERISIGSGSSKKRAEEEAAKKAYETLNLNG